MIALILLIISTVIGAGFATGAELLSFFGKTGLPPILIAAVVGFFLLLIMSALLFLVPRKQNKVIRHAFTAIYFAVFIVMTAGLMHLSGVITTIIALVFCIAIVMFGFDKLLFVNKYLILFVLAILLFASITNLNGDNSVLLHAEGAKWAQGVALCLLYAGMNCCSLERIFTTAPAKYSRKKILVACVIATVIICIFIALILTAIMRQNVITAMPILVLSNNIITKAAVFLSILTSMMICLYNITTPASRKQRLAAPTAICLLAFGFSFLGFQSVLAFLYPLIGGCMILYVLWLICCRAWYCLRLRCRKSRNFFIVNNTVDCLKVVKDQ